MQRTLSLLLLTLTLAAVSLLGAACGRTEPDDLAVIAPEATATPRPTVAQPTPTFTVPAPPQPQTVLPAPLYFLGENDQIMRLEADGLYVTQVTNEEQPITSFDVSPTDGRLAYVSGNSLIEVGPGGVRVVKVAGEPLPADDAAERLTQEISHVRFSPDGEQIAFGRNGVNLIDVGESTAYVKVQESSPVPDPETPPEEPARFYRPQAWSPGGERLLMEVAYWPEAGGLAIKQLESNETADITSDEPDSVLCCQWAWGVNGQFGYIASNLLAYGTPGLARADADTGNAVTLLRGAPQGEVGPDNPLRFFAAPHQAQPGQLLAFVGSETELGGDPGYVMSRISFAEDGRVTDLVSLRADEYPLIGQVLWAEDGRGALLVNARDYGDGPFPPGPLVWLTASGSPAVELPARGSQMRWGVPGVDAPAVQPVATAEPAVATAEATGTETPNDAPPAEATPEDATPETETPESETPTTPAPGADAGDLPAVAADAFGIDPQSDESFDGIGVTPLQMAGETRYWVAYTTGMRDFENERDHQLAIYAQDEAGAWQLVTQTTLTDSNAPEGEASSPDYLSDTAVTQVDVAPDRIWIQVEGGVGAHSGVYQLYSFDGETLTLAATGFSSSPGAGGVVDLNSDGIGEVLLDATDYYVFCYACGVREVHNQILRWNGEELIPIELTRLGQDAPDALRDLNNRAIELAEAGLWKNALAAMEEALALETEWEASETTFQSNAMYILHNASLKRDAVEESAYPLLAYVFYGDHNAAVDLMRAYEPAQIFSPDSPLIVDTVAEQWVETLGTRLVEELGPALALEPDLAAARFLLGWALWLQDPDSVDAVDAVARAAELAPNDALYAASLAYLQSGEADATPTPTPAPLSSPGGRILFSAQDPEDGSRNVYAVSLGDGTVGKLVNNAIQPQLHPNGVRVAFASTRDDMLGLGGFDLDTGERVRFTFNAEDRLPAWHPTTDRLVFASNRAGDRIWRVYATWADGNGNDSVLTLGQDPDWHPAGERIVYKGCDDSGARCGLWTMNGEGADRQPLTNNPGDSRPRWTPDGDAVVFMSDQRDGNWELYLVEAASGDVTRLTDNPANDGLPAISPDGSEVAFVSDREGDWQIWRVPRNGGAAQLVTPIPGELPNWLDEGLDWTE
jgi:Tol biopolymer transport system component